MKRVYTAFEPQKTAEQLAATLAEPVVFVRGDEEYECLPVTPPDAHTPMLVLVVLPTKNPGRVHEVEAYADHIPRIPPGFSVECALRICRDRWIRAGVPVVRVLTPCRCVASDYGSPDLPEVALGMPWLLRGINERLGTNGQGTWGRAEEMRRALSIAVYDILQTPPTDFLEEDIRRRWQLALHEVMKLAGRGARADRVKEFVRTALVQNNLMDAWAVSAAEAVRQIWRIKRAGRKAVAAAQERLAATATSQQK